MPVFYSPFCPKSVAEGQGPAILLQLILYELIHAKNVVLEETPSVSCGPFPWSQKVGSRNKVHEHAALLGYAFPHFKGEAFRFQESLHIPCKQLFWLLEPFFIACKGNRYLLNFLHQHQTVPEIQSILKWMS
jgi:hypothetical protein